MKEMTPRNLCPPSECRVTTSCVCVFPVRAVPAGSGPVRRGFSGRRSSGLPAGPAGSHHPLRRLQRAALRRPRYVSIWRYQLEGSVSYPVETVVKKSVFSIRCDIVYCAAVNKTLLLLMIQPATTRMRCADETSTTDDVLAATGQF